MRIAPVISLGEAERLRLQKIARSPRTEQRLVQRIRIILLADSGLSNQEIASQLQTSQQTVGLWRQRYFLQGFSGIEKDAEGRGRRPSVLLPKKIDEIIAKTTQEKPKDATHWSARRMAKEIGVGPTSILSVWREHGLKPHRIETFKLSKDPRFVEKLEDIVGLYLNPPEHALVFSADEKSQIQALDRTQPNLPLSKGYTETMTHDYTRHGTTTLFAALSTLDGKVISMCRERHTHKEWLSFLRLINAKTPVGKELHIIADNYATHKHPEVRAWLSKHPHIHMHFTPTSSSWLNMVERFFRDITQKRIRRGSFRSVSDLIQAISEYIAQHNTQPKPFIWTAKATDILAKVTRARGRAESSS